MPESAHDLRETIVEKMPDVTDPANWPTEALTALAGRLIPALEIIDSMRDVVRATGVATTVRISDAARAVQDAREALALLETMSPLAAWRTLHPPRLEPLDGIYDCGNPGCPAAGFRDAEDKALHYSRWVM